LPTQTDDGVDIEEIAEKTMDKTKKMLVDIHTGVTDVMATEVGFAWTMVAQCAKQIKNLYKTFLTLDCLPMT
jgi:succinyl-CoA synthetase beta subunit